MEGVKVEAKESQNPPAGCHQYNVYVYTLAARWGVEVLTVGVENQEGEGVSQDPLERPTDYHE